MEMFIMGDAKNDFINFLSDCFKSDFFETLSWGLFKRYQLILRSKDSWISIYFIILTKEQNMDLIVTNFKLYEKRNLLLMFYNICDQKSEKNVEGLYNNFLEERNKIYEGILNEDKIKENLNKISTLELDPEDIKTNLKFLVDNEENLVYKIGITSSSSKKGKQSKKGSGDTSPYDLSQEIFFLNIKGEEIKTNFQGMISLLIKEHLSYLKYELEDESMLIFKSLDKIENKKHPKKRDFIFKCIDALAVLYLAVAVYYFMK